MKYAYASIALASALAAVFLAPFTRVIYCGLELGSLSSVLINSILVMLPLILYLGFSQPTVTIWYIAFLYHVFLTVIRFGVTLMGLRVQGHPVLKLNCMVDSSCVRHCEFLANERTDIRDHPVIEALPADVKGTAPGLIRISPDRRHGYCSRKRSLIRTEIDVYLLHYPMGKNKDTGTIDRGSG